MEVSISKSIKTFAKQDTTSLDLSSAVLRFAIQGALTDAAMATQKL
jgi:hypothetical protein